MNSTTHDPLSLRNQLWLLFLVWLVLFVIAMTGAPTLLDNERRVGGYILDAVQNGDWFIQKDALGHIASKPPVLTWLAGSITLVIGRLTRFAVYLPTALALLGTAFAICLAGRKYFGWLAGFLGALSFLLSPLANSVLTTARYDGLFMLPVLLGAIAAHHAWATGRGWTWFWLAAAVSTLIKGPLGLILSSLGLLAVIWEWRSGNRLKPRGNHLIGIACYFLICGGWFALAYWQMGQPLVDKMIGKELLKHSVGSEERNILKGFYRPTWNVIGYYLPWSLFAIPALIRIWKKPSADDNIRRFERFIVCWLFVGLVIFSLSSHQRGRLIFPLIPAMALLAGRQMAFMVESWSVRRLRNTIKVTVLAAVAMFVIHRHVILHFREDTKDTMTIYAFTDTLRANLGEDFPLTYVDAPYAVQFCLNTYRPRISMKKAAELLRGDEPVFIAVVRMDRLISKLGADAPVLHEFMKQNLQDDEILRIVSNHPRLEWTDSMAAVFGPLELHMNHVQLIEQEGDLLIFKRHDPASSAVTITNTSDESQRVRLRFVDDQRGLQERHLSPDETWKP
jgi:4-amino-4-deoxy-L-arabinose transferase-like glycosyltransferase